MTDGLKAHHRAAIIATLAANDRVEKAVLFGSRAMGTNTVTSDVDIALFGHQLTLTDQAKLAAACEELPMAQSVDLVLHSTIDNPTLVEHICSHGVEWYRRGGGSEVGRVGQGDSVSEGRGWDMDSEWKKIPIKEIGRVVTGKTPSTRCSEYYGGSIPFYTPSDMDGRKNIESTRRTLTQSGLATVKGSVIPAGSVMVSCIGSDMGKVALAVQDGISNQQINSIIVNKEFCAEYIYYELSARQNELKVLSSSGSAQPILNKSHFSEVCITVPSLPEQKAIAHVLGTIDDKIELNHKTNETLEAMARALFKSWFVDFDPVRAKAEGRSTGLPDEVSALFPDSFEDSELGEIPRGWGVATLGAVAASPRRSLHPKEISPQTPYVGLEHMPKQSIALSDWGTSDGLASSKFQFNRGEILFGKLRPYFHKVGVAPVDGVCSTDIVVVVPRIPPWFGFVLGHTSSTEFISYTDASSTGTRMPRTSWKDMARYALVLPPEPVAAAFTELIQSMTDRLISGIYESRTLTALRDALLPRLVSGELKIPDAEKVMEVAV